MNRLILDAVTTLAVVAVVTLPAVLLLVGLYRP